MNHPTSKTAFITGGSRGLGRDTALRLAKNGKDIIFTYINNQNAAKKTSAAIKKLGQRVHYIQLDVSDMSSFSQAKSEIETILSSWGKEGLDFVINNAGIGAHMMIGQGEEEVFDQLMKVHFKGAYFLTEALVPILNQGGGIVNISTGLTRFTFPGYGAYASFKGAIETYTQYLAKELGPKRIRANIVAPGAIQNDFNKAAFDHNPQIVDIIAQNTALGRVGQSEDIGGVVAFLCSEDARWVNAQRIEASGGMFI